MLQKIREQYNSWFNKNKESIIIEEKKTNDLIDAFLGKYTKTSIQNMKLDDYVIGNRNKDSFCYWIEYKLEKSGSIHMGNSNKFGIYYDKWNKKYKIQIPKFNSNPDLAFDEIKREIIYLIDASKKHNINAITNSKLANTVRNKISYLYNRNDYIPIYSKPHIDKLLKIFLITSKKSESIESKKNKLFEFYKNLNLYECSPLRFMNFIYDKDGYRDELFGKSESKSIKNKEIEKLRSEKNFTNQIPEYDQELANCNNEITIKNHKYFEGQLIKEEIMIGERSIPARDAYLKEYGFNCKLCGKFYLKSDGTNRIIDVHHLNPIRHGKRGTDIHKDLKGLCPNCHRFVHSIKDFENKSWKEIEQLFNKIYKNNN